MEDVSRQLLYQRLRNRVIELFELHASLEDVASLGAFEAINTVDDWLPIDCEEVPKVFGEQEKEAITKFLHLADRASEATDRDIRDIAWFRSTKEWVTLSAFAEKASHIFHERGRFSEEKEDVLPP